MEDKIEIREGNLLDVIAEDEKDIRLCVVFLRIGRQTWKNKRAAH